MKNEHNNNEADDFSTYKGDIRSKLHTLETVQWLRKIKKNTTKKTYLYYQQEHLRQLEVRKIFTKFDVDKSSYLLIIKYNILNRVLGFRWSFGNVSQI